MIKRALIALGFCVFTASFAGSGIAADAPKPVNATPAMWFVQGPKGAAYMLGSIHALPKNVNWQTPQIVAAMKKADTFVFEIPMDEDNRTRLGGLFVKNGLLPISLSLPSLFDAEMRDEWRQVIDQTHADPTLLVYMRPWLAAVVLQGEVSGTSDYISSEGVDNKVYAFAKQRGVKQYRAFETNELQMGVLMRLGGSGDEMQALRSTFKDILDRRYDETSTLLAAWSKGDTQALTRLGPENPNSTAEDEKLLLDNRNRSWIPQIETMLAEKHTYFITVGAAHLVGKTGVPNLLRAAGYKVDGP